jgi:hypothetical protein
MAWALTNASKSAADRVAKRHEQRRKNAIEGHGRNPESYAQPTGHRSRQPSLGDVGALVFDAPCYVACNMSDRSKRLGSCEREHASRARSLRLAPLTKRVGQIS